MSWASSAGACCNTVVGHSFTFAVQHEGVVAKPNEGMAIRSETSAEAHERRLTNQSGQAAENMLSGAHSLLSGDLNLLHALRRP